MAQPRSIGLFSFLLPPHARDGQLLPVLQAREILANNQSSINSIWQSAGIPDSQYERLYRHPITRTAELIQSCPATPAGHHAWTGGLIAHILSSCAFALRLRKGLILPTGSMPELASKKADLYTYAVFAATLLGEIGPVLDSLEIALFDRRGRYLCEWDPLLDGIAPGRTRARYMKVRFRPDPCGRPGRTTSLMHAGRILPKEGFRWIREDPEAYAAFLGAFSDAPDGPVHRLMTQGMQASVAMAPGARKDPSPDTEPGHPPAKRLRPECPPSPRTGSRTYANPVPGDPPAGDREPVSRNSRCPNGDAVPPPPGRRRRRRRR